MKRTSPAKITRPGLSGIVKRERLFRLLDAKRERPVIWISSPAGSGKTKLVAGYFQARHLPCIWYQCDEGDADPGTFFHYMSLAAVNAAPRRRIVLPQLTPEYFQNIPAFARRYFEQLSSRVLSRRQREFFIVLDDYQSVPAEDSFHGMIENALEAVASGIHVVIISRNDPPAAFARLQANDRLSILQYGDLRFTLEEARELVDKRVVDLSPEEIKAVHEKTEGWASGIVLMLERVRMEGHETLLYDDVAYGRIFDYFAGEIFKKADKGIQIFLLKTAFLRSLNTTQAEHLSGERLAGFILTTLNRLNYFTEKLAGGGQNYRYHPLFRNYLIKQAKAFFSPGELFALQMKAAQTLEDNGNVEDAARLYGDAGEKQQLARIVIDYARIFLRQGRNKTVAEWLAAIPRPMLEGNPWLLYWSGMCSFPSDMIHTRNSMEKALSVFQVTNDPAGVYLSWAGIVDSYSYSFGEWDELDRYIEVFNNLQKMYPFPESDEIGLIAASRILISLILRKIENTRLILHWFEHLSRLLEKNPFPEIYLIATFFMSTYYLWKGEYGSNALLLEKAADTLQEDSPPLSVISIKLMTGIHHWVTAQYDTAENVLTAGLAVAEESGIYNYNSLLWSFLAAVKIATGSKAAEQTIQEQKKAALRSSHPLDMYFYHINSAWLALLNEDARLAAMHMEAIATSSARMGHPYYLALWHIGMAQVMYSQKRTGDARTNISRALEISRSVKSTVIEWYSLLVTAWFHFGEGSDKEGMKMLRRGMALGRKHGYVHLEFYQPAVMRFLCAKALEQGIEEDYSRSLIKKLGLTPPASGMQCLNAAIPDLSNWPYPVKIYTLGRFAMFEDGVQIQGAGKMQKKPVEMFKALIAAGGTDVSAASIAEELWPDADGDLARKSFEATLSRLRRLFDKDIIISGAGQLSINLDCCLVDSFMLAGIIEKAGKAPARQLCVLCEKALSLYKGHFLPDDTALAWSVQRREMLKNDILQIIFKAGQHSEQAGECEKAMGYYEKGLEIDPLTEELYQRLMICHQKLGRKAAAVKAYHRCSELLFKHLGIKPSAKTETIYSSLLQNC